MSTPLRILIVEDSPADTALLILALRKSGYEPAHERVDTAEAMAAALSRQAWDLVTADYVMPGFSGMAALQVLQESGLDLPLIIVSGKIREETAIELMRSGARDYVMKDNLERLGPAIARELQDAAARRERQRAQAALLASEARFRALFEHARDGIVVLDGETGRIVDCNDEFVNMTGRSRKELLNVPLWRLGPPEEEEPLRAVLSEARQKEGIRCADLDFQKPNGTHVPIEFSARALTIGERRYIQSICRDVSERKQAEAALAESEATYRAIGESIPFGIWICDPDGGVVYLSDSFLELVGMTLEECKRFGWVSHLPPDDVERTLHDWRACVRNACFWRYEYHIRGTDGIYRTILSRGIPIRDSTGQITRWVGINLDITDLKRVEDELRKALRELHASQQLIIQSEKLAALGTLAAGVAHELNNPLMGVMNFVGFVRQRVDDPETRYPLDRAEQELTRMRDLLKSLLAFARPSSESLTTVDLQMVLERTFSLLSPEFRARQIAFVYDAPPTLPPVRGLEGPMQQALVNLLLNARDAVEKSAHKQVTLRAYARGDEVLVEVADNGEGIPEAIQGRIFDPFFTTKPPGKGTGLGLAIVQSIMADHGGRIELQSHAGKGSMFTLRFPMAQQTDPKRSAEHA